MRIKGEYSPREFNTTGNPDLDFATMERPLMLVGTDFDDTDLNFVGIIDEFTIFDIPELNNSVTNCLFD